MLTCTKIYRDIPFAHRQHLHTGHCKFIHGHNWSFEFTFGATGRDANGFVIDFGSLRWLRDILEEFDHALLINEDDPYRVHFQETLTAFNLAKIVIVPNGGAEGLANYLYGRLRPILESRYSGRVFLTQVRVFEDDKNSATLTPQCLYAHMAGSEHTG